MVVMCIFCHCDRVRKYSGFPHLKTLQNNKLVKKSMGGDDGCGVDAENGHADDELGEKTRKMVTNRSGGGLAVC